VRVDNIRWRCFGTKKEDVERGQVCQAGFDTPHTNFHCAGVHLDQGGGAAGITAVLHELSPASAGHFRIIWIDRSGGASGGYGMVMPGDNSRDDGGGSVSPYARMDEVCRDP